MVWKNPITVINYIIIYAVNSCSWNLWHQIEIKGPSRKDFVSLRRDFFSVVICCCVWWLIVVEKKFHHVDVRIFYTLKFLWDSTYFFTTKAGKSDTQKKPKILKCHHSIYTRSIIEAYGKMCKFLLTYGKNCTYTKCWMIVDTKIAAISRLYFFSGCHKKKIHQDRMDDDIF